MQLQFSQSNLWRKFGSNYPILLRFDDKFERCMLKVLQRLLRPSMLKPIMERKESHFTAHSQDCTLGQNHRKKLRQITNHILKTFLYYLPKGFAQTLQILMMIVYCPFFFKLAQCAQCDCSMVHARKKQKWDYGLERNQR